MKAKLSTITLMAPVYGAALVALFGMLSEAAPDAAAWLFGVAFGIDLYRPVVPAEWTAPALGLLGWVAVSNLLAWLGLAAHHHAPGLWGRLHRCARRLRTVLSAQARTPLTEDAGRSGRQ